MYQAEITVHLAKAPGVFLLGDERQARTRALELAHAVGGELVAVEDTEAPTPTRCLVCGEHLGDAHLRHQGLCTPCSRRGRALDAQQAFRRRVVEHQDAWLRHVNQQLAEVA